MTSLENLKKMYAIVEIAGKQYKVEEKKFLYVDKLDAKIDSKIDFDKVLLVDNGSIAVGTPSVKGAKVSAKVLDQVRGDKVIVFKKKRRKGYQKSNGHKQEYTKILVEKISA